MNHVNLSGVLRKVLMGIVILLISIIDELIILKKLCLK